jgi:hypothetical protein
MIWATLSTDVYAEGGRTLVAHPGLHTVVERFACVAAGLIAPGVKFAFGRPILDELACGVLVGVRPPPVTGLTAGSVATTAVGTGAPPVVSLWKPKPTTNAMLPRTRASPTSRLVVSRRPRGYRTVKEVSTLPDRLPRSQLT